MNFFPILFQILRLINTGGNWDVLLVDRTPWQKNNKETLTLKNTLDQLDFTDIYRTFHPKEKNTHSSQVHVEYSLG